jgi:hypothetical protein
VVRAGPHDEIDRKQWLLRDTARRERSLRLKHHHSGISWVEGLLARGDRRLADVIEAVWRAAPASTAGTRCSTLERWQQAHARPPGSSPRRTSGPARWRRGSRGTTSTWASKTASCSASTDGAAGRASPPCGKVAGQLVHHANLVDASADARRLVCYDCGVACDLTKMREDRLVALRALGAVGPAVVVPAAPARADAAALELPGDVGERGGGSPAERDEHDGDERSADASPARAPRPDARDNARRERVRLRGFVGADTPYTRYRIWFAKVDRVAFLGHLDLGRLWARIFRRAELELAMSRGFSPKPRIAFGPALGPGGPQPG